MAIRRIQGTQNWLSEHNKALKNGYPNKIRHSKMAIRTYQGTQKWLSEHIRSSKTGYPRKCDTATSRNQGIHFLLFTRNQGTQIWLSTAILGIPIWLSIQKTMASSFGYTPKNIGTQNWLSRKKQWQWTKPLIILFAYYKWMHMFQFSIIFVSEKAFGLSPYRIFGLPTHPTPLFKIQQNSFTFNT